MPAMTAALLISISPFRLLPHETYALGNVSVKRCSHIRHLCVIGGGAAPESGDVIDRKRGAQLRQSVRLNYSSGGLTSSVDGVVRVWALELEDLIGIARDELQRGFTQAECRRYLHRSECPGGSERSAGP